MDLLGVFMKFCYSPKAKHSKLVTRTQMMFLHDENEGTRYLQRRLATEQEAIS